MATTFITPVDVTHETSDNWADIDVSAHVSASATGVIIRVTATSFVYDTLGFRKNGSTDSRINPSGAGHITVCVGIDESGIFECYLDDHTNNSVYLLGYYEDEAVFATNASDHSIGSTGTWTDIDISADTSGDARGAIFEKVHTSGQVRAFKFRKNGSADDRYTTSNNSNEHSSIVIGLDEGEICEGIISNTDVDFFLTGYIISESYFYHNAIDYSLGSTGSYIDLTALPTGSIGAYFEYDASDKYSFFMRKNGSSEDFYSDGTGEADYYIVDCDSSGLIEAKIENTALDFYLNGFVLPRTAEITDPFTRADSDTLGSPWTEVFTGGGGDIDIVSNQAKVIDRGSGDRVTMLHTVTALSSPDHYAQFVATGSYSSAHALRSDSGRNNYYKVHLAGGTTLNLYRIVSDSQSGVVGSLTITFSDGDTVLCWVETYDASTVRIHAAVNGYYYGYIDDTNAARLTSGSYTGMEAGLNNNIIDDFESGILGVVSSTSIATVASVAQASIAEVASVAEASIEAVATVSNTS